MDLFKHSHTKQISFLYKKKCDVTSSHPFALSPRFALFVLYRCGISFELCKLLSARKPMNATTRFGILANVSKEKIELSGGMINAKQARITWTFIFPYKIQFSWN